jgi:hypothetical protein
MSAQSRSTSWSTLASRSARGSRLAGVLSAAALSLVLAAPASAAAIVTRDSVTTPIFETGLSDDCRPSTTGILTGTDVVTYQSVETSQGFHVVLTVVDTGQIAWSDGTYTIIEAIGHVSFIDTRAGTTVLTVAHEDSGNTYSAEGVFLSRATFHIVERLTVTDGVVRVEFERGRPHFFDGC